MVDGIKSSSGMRILIVDDYSLTRSMVQSILKGAGFQHVVHAENGAAALERLEQDDFDLVICDWKMPGVTGIEVLQHMRSQPRYKHIPFLMLTAEAYRSSVEQAMQAGVTDYVVKPFTASTLLEKVRTILKTKT